MKNKIEKLLKEFNAQTFASNEDVTEHLRIAIKLLVKEAEIDFIKKLTKNIGRVVSSSKFIEKQNVERTIAIDIDNYEKEDIAREIGGVLLDEGVINFKEDTRIGERIMKAEFRYIKIGDITKFIKNN